MRGWLIRNNKVEKPLTNCLKQRERTGERENVRCTVRDKTKHLYDLEFEMLPRGRFWIIPVLTKIADIGNNRRALGPQKFSRKKTKFVPPWYRSNSPELKKKKNQRTLGKRLFRCFLRQKLAKYNMSSSDVSPSRRSVNIWCSKQKKTTPESN